MILYDSQKRLILWGAELTESFVLAELVFADCGLARNTTHLRTRDNSVNVEVTLPDQIKYLYMPTKALNLIFPLVKSSVDSLML